MLEERVALEVVHAQEGQTARERQTLRRGQADEQRPDEMIILAGTIDAASSS